jgi:hypothetical protein
MLSLATCILLKEAGYTQDIECHYRSKAFEEANGYYKESETNPIACPSFDEIWTLLPEAITTYGSRYELTLQKASNNKSCIYYYYRITDIAGSTLISTMENSPVEAAAKMWLLIQKQRKFMLPIEISTNDVSSLYPNN